MRFGNERIGNYVFEEKFRKEIWCSKTSTSEAQNRIEVTRCIIQGGSGVANGTKTQKIRADGTRCGGDIKIKIVVTDYQRIKNDVI